MAVCATCVGLLDVVVAEWRRDDLSGDEGAVCVACGAPAQMSLSPLLPPPEAVIAVDLTGPVIRVDVAGALDGAGADVVAAEINTLADRSEPIVLNLVEVTRLGVDARQSLAALIAGMGAERPVGIVTPTGWRGRTFGLGQGRADGDAPVVVSSDLAVVISQLATGVT